MGLIRRLEHQYRVRFDEADADGWLRPSGLLRYAQDMAWRHSEEAGFDRAYYDARGMDWLVRNVKVDIAARVTYGDVLAVSTQVVGWRHVWARRHCQIRRVGSSQGQAESTLMATVETDWVLLSRSGRPARVPVEIAAYFGPVVPFARDRIVLPEPTAGMAMLTTRVRPLDVDPMQHMNNAAYLDMVDDGLGRLPAGSGPGQPDCYRVGYVAPALPGASLHIECWATDHGSQAACRISDADGNELTKALTGRTRS